MMEKGWRISIYMDGCNTEFISAYPSRKAAHATCPASRATSDAVSPWLLTMLGSAEASMRSRAH